MIPRTTASCSRSASVSDHRHLNIPEFTLASYNAHWGIGRFGALDRQPFDLAAVIRGFDADVVVVPESWRELDGRGVLDDLVNDGYRIEIVPFATFRRDASEPEPLMPGEGHWDLALCSRLPITARRDLPVCRVPGDRAVTRAAMTCTIDVGGTEVDVVALHVSSKIWKLAPVRHLRSLRPHLPPPDRTAVIAGDFNFWGPGVVRLFPGWRRAVLGRTYPSRRPHSQIDHILVRTGVEVVASEVFPQNPSDHRAIRARLRVAAPQRAGAADSVG